MAFRQCFLRPSDLTKIVLPKVLQNFKFHLLAQGTEPKRFPHNIQCRTRPKGPPPFQFFRHCETFFGKKFPKGSPFNFFWVLRQTGYRKIPKGPSFQFFFGVVRLFSKKVCSAVEENTLKLWCPFAIFEPWIWRRLGPVPACFIHSCIPWFSSPQNDNHFCLKKNLAPMNNKFDMLKST